MIYNELNPTRHQTIALLRDEWQRGCGPDGYPDVMPMWRVESGVETEGTRTEVLALRVALARLREQDAHAHALLTSLAAGKPPAAADWPTVTAALDALDAAVEEALNHG